MSDTVSGKAVDSFADQVKQIVEDSRPLRPSVSIGEVTKAVDERFAQDRAIVRAAWRDVVSLAIEHLCGRSPSRTSVRDMMFEEKMWDLIEREFVPKKDFSGRES